MALTEGNRRMAVAQYWEAGLLGTNAHTPARPVGAVNLTLIHTDYHFSIVKARFHAIQYVQRQANQLSVCAEPLRSHFIIVIYRQCAVGTKCLLFRSIKMKKKTCRRRKLMKRTSICKFRFSFSFFDGSWYCFLVYVSWRAHGDIKSWHCNVSCFSGK